MAMLKEQQFVCFLFQCFFYLKEEKEEGVNCKYKQNDYSVHQ